MGGGTQRSAGAALVPADPDPVDAIRTGIGRPEVRWEELRGVFATYYLQAGGEPRTLQHVLGHAAISMMLRYLRRILVESRRHVSETARRAGLITPVLKFEKRGA